MVGVSDSRSEWVRGHAGDGSGSFEVKLADGIKVSDEYNHLSVWCVDFTIDFGNAVITCPDQMMG